MRRKKIDNKFYVSFRLRTLLNEALVKCCTTSEKSVSKMSTSEDEEEKDATPDLEELDSDNEEEHTTLTYILQKISDCKDDL